MQSFLSQSGIGGTVERIPFSVQRGVAVLCLCLTVLAIGLLAAAEPAGAEDEDTSSSVYLVFDPETGEFVTSHDPKQALPNQTGLEDSKATTPADQEGGVNADRADRAETTGGGFPGALLVLIIVGAIVIAGGTFLILRRAPRNGGRRQGA